MSSEKHGTGSNRLCEFQPWLQALPRSDLCADWPASQCTTGDGLQVVTDFFDELKSRSKGYASMEYKVTGYRINDLVRLDIRVRRRAPALTALSRASHNAPTGPMVATRLRMPGRIEMTNVTACGSTRTGCCTGTGKSKVGHTPASRSTPRCMAWQRVNTTNPLSCCFVDQRRAGGSAGDDRAPRRRVPRRQGPDAAAKGAHPAAAVQGAHPGRHRRPRRRLGVDLRCASLPLQLLPVSASAHCLCQL